MSTPHTPGDAELSQAAAYIAATMLEKDPAVAETLALIEGVRDSYELAALHYFRVLNALKRRRDQPEEGQGE